MTNKIGLKKWIETCVICNKKFTTYEFLRNWCSEDCRLEKVKRWNDKNNYPTRYLKLRFSVFQRDNFTCQYCGRTPSEDNVKLEADHIKPRCKGGQDELNNLITSCRDCNIGKFDVLLDERIKVKKAKN